MHGDRLIYLPLGGSGEVGMNAYVYGYGPKDAERLILVDMGVTFGDMDTTPGVDLIFPDFQWLIERADRLEAIIITHGHEDHIGALGHFWDKLQAPVFCRKFTGALAVRKMDEHGADVGSVQVLGPMPAAAQLGPFTVSFLPVSHSIPESSALVIDTPAGRVVHTGDFKLDADPVVGEPFDEELWSAIGQSGVQALVCDSTNVQVGHAGRSESTVGPAIEELVLASRGMVVATTFASNVARVKTLADAAKKAGRSVCLMGRAMKRMVTVAVETGVLTDFPATVSPEDARQIPRENLMLLATGSQGERRAATAQLARGKYLGMEMKEGDTFLFSSKTIPGNERGVIDIINAFSRMGVEVVDDSAGLYHVSGHANGPDLARLHGIVKPKMVVPMHGEHRMLSRHAKMASVNGLPSIVAVNGTMLRLDGPKPEVVEHIETGRIYLDGSVKVGAFDGIVRDRIRMALNGHVVVTLIIDEEDEPLGEPWAELRGLSEIGTSGAALVEVLENDIQQAMFRADPKTLRNDDALEESIRRVVRQVCVTEIGRKPEVSVIVSRLS